MPSVRNVILVVLALNGLAAASARQEYKRDFRQSVALASGRTLRIESQFGSINIHGEPRKDAAIQASIHCSADTLDGARRCVDQIRIGVFYNSSGVQVRTDYPPNTNGRDLSFAVDYDIAMPDDAILDLHNRYGSAEVSGLHASSTISSSNGSVRFLNGRGTQHIENTFGMMEVRKNEGDVTISNSGGPTFAVDITGSLDITERYGEVRVSHAGRDVGIHGHNCNISVAGAGGPVNVTNDFGVVTVSGIKSDVTVQNQNADVTATDIAGKADLRNDFAAITFSRIGKALEVHGKGAMVRGDTVGGAAVIETSSVPVDVRGIQGSARITTDNGYVRASGIGGDLYAKTSFAEITIGGVGGALTVEAQNSPVMVSAKSAQRCQPISIRTSFGPIRVTIAHVIASGRGYNVTAHTTFGSVHSDPVVQANAASDPSHGALTGKIGGGGCELRLANQNGSIDILH